VSFEQLVVVSLAAAVAAIGLAGALVAWRVLGRAGTDMRRLEERLTARALTMPHGAVATRQRLTALRAQSESALWTISNLDARLERTELALAGGRAASDSLRASMARNRRRLVQLRNGARMLLRAIQLRREFLG
jgi:hypothetical protein